jgi:hypothetical protein
MVACAGGVLHVLDHREEVPYERSAPDREVVLHPPPVTEGVAGLHTRSDHG